MKTHSRRLALGLTGALFVTALTAAAPAPVVLQTTEFGHGPTLVFVHGMGGTRLGWMPTARKLLANYRIVMVDLPGHGDSPLPDPFSLDAAAEALDQVVARQNADSTIVVGQGVGGLLALMSASAHPNHQRGVIVIDASLKSPLAIDDQQKKAFLDFMDQNRDAVGRLLFSKMGRDSAQGVAIYAQASQVPMLTLKSYLRELLGVDGNRALRNLKDPMLLVLTDHALPDGQAWPAVAKTLGWENPAAVTPRRITNAAALIASDQPDTLALVVGDFAKQAFADKQPVAAK